jgi:hypothetical protein
MITLQDQYNLTYSNEKTQKRGICPLPPNVLVVAASQGNGDKFVEKDVQRNPAIAERFASKCRQFLLRSR